MIWAVNIRGKAEGKAAGPDETPFHPGVQRGASGKLTSRRRTHAAIRSRPVADLEWKRRRSAAFPVAKKALVLPAPLQSPVWGCLKKGSMGAGRLLPVVLKPSKALQGIEAWGFTGNEAIIIGLSYELALKHKLSLQVRNINGQWNLSGHRCLVWFR